MKTVLVLVDLQNDYLNDSIEPHYQSIISQTARLLGFFRSRDLPVIHVLTTISEKLDDRMVHWKTRNVWKCVEGTEGHQPPSELSPLASEYIVHKKGFDPFRESDLEEITSKLGIQAAVICGVHLHACVRQTAIGFFELGVKVCVVEDAVGSHDPVHAAITRRYFEERNIKFAPVNEILEAPLPDFLSSNVEMFDSMQKASEVLDRNPSSIEDRLELVADFRNRLNDCKEELAQLICDETGKPIVFSRIEVEKSVESIDDILINFRQWKPEEEFDGFVVRHQPLGRVAVITPWNNPVFIPIGKIIPAFLYGNTVLWKVAPQAEETSDYVMNIFQKSGIGPELISMANGNSKETISLISNQLIDAVTFTGSILAGYCVQEICAKRHIPLQAELGGNNAAIVWPDSDLPDAANKICHGAFDMSGQRCTANRRAIVHKDCYDQFIELIKSAMSQLSQGDPSQESTTVGPIIGNRQYKRIKSVIERALSSCEDCFQAIDPNINYDCHIAPTLIECNQSNLEVVVEETFGPVLVVQKADSWNHAIELCNKVKHGLVASVFTKSSELKEKFKRQALAGMLKINKATSDVMIGAPFGGWKASGVGEPEHGMCDSQFYTRIQTLYP